MAIAIALVKSMVDGGSDDGGGHDGYDDDDECAAERIHRPGITWHTAFGRLLSTTLLFYILGITHKRNGRDSL